MTTTRNFAIILLLTALSYLALTLTATLTPALQNLSSTTDQSGYSPYTMYERCHMDAKGVMHPYYTHRADCS